MNYNQKVGQFGEMLAKNYLIKHGYQIVATNIKTSYQEIDIIAKHGQLNIFIEVKTRTNLIFGGADEAINRRKLKNLKKAINHIIYKNNLDENFVQIDLVAIDINKFKKTAKIKHYKNIS
ncbi:MAG: YraN family protein [Patescibacteria group bacterium]